MDISLIKAPRSMYLRTWIYIAEICLEESVSQNVDLGLSFCFMVCRRRGFEKDYKKSQKLPGFCHKIITKA